MPVAEKSVVFLYDFYITRRESYDKNFFPFFKFSHFYNLDRRYSSYSSILVIQNARRIFTRVRSKGNARDSAVDRAVAASSNFTSEFSLTRGRSLPMVDRRFLDNHSREGRRIS